MAINDISKLRAKVMKKEYDSGIFTKSELDEPIRNILEEDMMLDGCHLFQYCQSARSPICPGQYCTDCEEKGLYVHKKSEEMGGEQ